jgi:hypothetical protein
MISGFHHNADEICALLGYNTALSGNPLPTFQDNVLVPSSKGQEVQEDYLDFVTLEDGTNTSSQNISKGLPLDTEL